MKVWILLKGYDYSPTEVVGLYLSSAAAKRAAADLAAGDEILWGGYESNRTPRNTLVSTEVGPMRASSTYFDLEEHEVPTGTATEGK